MIPRIWDAWVVLLYYTSFASPCGLFSRCAVVISWKNQPCVVVSTSFKWRQILCLTGISDIKLQRRKSTDLWETLHGHMHWMERALGTKSPFGLICRGENKKLLERSLCIGKESLGVICPKKLLLSSGCVDVLSASSHCSSCVLMCSGCLQWSHGSTFGAHSNSWCQLTLKEDMQQKPWLSSQPVPVLKQEHMWRVTTMAVGALIRLRAGDCDLSSLSQEIPCNELGDSAPSVSFRDVLGRWKLHRGGWTPKNTSQQAITFV